MVSLLSTCLYSWYDASRRALACVTDTALSISVLPPCVVEMDEEGTPLCSSQEFTSTRVSGCGATSSATCSLVRCARYLDQSSSTRENTRERSGGGRALDA